MSRVGTSAGGSRGALGFTLVEVMIAIAVVGILAAVALPSFLDSVRKSRRSDAFTALSAVQQAQERWRSNRASYAGSVSAAPSDDPPGLGLSATSAKGYYGVAISGASATGYTITATATTGTSQASDSGCQRLRIRVVAGNLFYGSAGLSGDFDESPGNRCWSQ